MSSFGNVAINVTHQHGAIVLGDGNVVNLQGLALPPDQQARLQAALDSLKPGAVPNADGAALKAVANEAPASRTAAVGRWLLKLAPAAVGVAGTLLNPAAGKLAEALAQWVAGQFDGG